VGIGEVFDVHLVYFEERESPIPTFYGAYSSKEIAGAVARHIETKGYNYPEIIDRKAVKLMTESSKIVTYLLDGELFIDNGLKTLAASIIDDLTEDQRAIILAGKPLD
jgi:hypothetical protein